MTLTFSIIGEKEGKLKKCKHCDEKISKKEHKKNDGFCWMCKDRYDDEQYNMYGPSNIVAG